VLSRVTIGADVAVTSVVLSCLWTMFPAAEIVLIGPPSLEELYGSSERLRIVRVQYSKEASLQDRLRTWIDVVHAIDAERRGLARSEYLIADPDSRLTQLGLLPVTEDDDRYFFFESRSYRRSGVRHLSQLTAEWCRERFACDSGVFPFVSISAKAREFGDQWSRWLRKQGTAGLAALNFGVGNNERKRLPLEFETRLVLALLARRYFVILDKGIGEEVVRANHIVQRVRATGKHVLELGTARQSHGRKLLTI
jgi:hypothetical protein